jgi:hypothetical protein
MFGSGGATSGGGTEYTFTNGPAARFGGYFGMNHPSAPDITVAFYNGTSLVNSFVVPLLSNCTWNWIGWDLAGLGVTRINIKTNQSSTGYVMMDDMQLDVGSGCPAPITYCTAKVNSLGCIPSIQCNGTPSATATSGCLIQCVNVRNNKAGILIYGLSGQAATPFSGGLFCLQLPIKRTPPVNSGGTPLPSSDCSGVYSLDMNSLSHGLLGGVPMAGLVVPGTVVNCQYWGVDPGFPAPNNTSLSGGLQYTVCP